MGNLYSVIKEEYSNGEWQQWYLENMYIDANQLLERGEEKQQADALRKIVLDKEIEEYIDLIYPE